MPQRWRRRNPSEANQFPVELKPRTGPMPGPEILPWYWHPARDGVTPCPEDFDRQLKEIHPSLFACFSPVHERWMIWAKSERRKNSLCSGWQLLFFWEHPTTKEYLPLSPLVFHNLFLIFRDKYPQAQTYFDNINVGIAKRKAEKEKDYQNLRRDSQSEMFESFKISTAGRGNKSALHDSGTIIESQGEANWRAETRKWRLPSEQLRREADDREKRFYGSY